MIKYSRGKNPNSRKGSFKKGNKIRLGKIPWNKDKKNIYSKKTLKKMSISASRIDRKLYKKHYIIKHKRSEDSKIRQSILAKKIGIGKWNKGKHYLHIPKGEKNIHWKGGITSINQKIRNSLEIKLWRKSCFERDNYTCQKTGQYGGKLVVHHINNFADFPELRTSIENGITLSDKSHKEFHKKYGKRNNNKEQLLEFLSII